MNIPKQEAEPNSISEDADRLSPQVENDSFRAGENVAGLTRAKSEQIRALVPIESPGSLVPFQVNRRQGFESPLPLQRERSDHDREALQSSENFLRDIEDGAAELVTLNMEHRVPDIRNNLPVFAQIRSHKLATREGQIIEQMHDDMAKLQSMVQQGKISLNTVGLSLAASALKKPEGITKWAATLLVFPREWNRGLVAPRAERVKQEASQLRRKIQQRQREGVLNLAA